MSKKGASIGFTIMQINATLIVIFILIIFIALTALFVTTNSLKDLGSYFEKNADFGNYEYYNINLKTQEVLSGILNYPLENNLKLKDEILKYYLLDSEDIEVLRDEIREVSNQVLKKDYLIKIYFLEYVSEKGNTEEEISVSNLDEDGIDSTTRFGDLNSVFYDIAEDSFYYQKKGVRIQLFVKK